MANTRTTTHKGTVRVGGETRTILIDGNRRIAGLDLLKAFCIIAAGFFIFVPALHGDWSDDDNFYLTANPLRGDPSHLWKTWFEPGSFIEYYPITETVQLAQWHLWRGDAFGYVLTNLVLHIINGLLVWRLLSKFGLPWAWLGGLLFVVHPLNVESVAWISELKNTLSLPPFLLAMCAWIDYEERKRNRDYWLALVLFVLAMLCKITMAPFPLVILLYAWWKRGRIGVRDLMAILPFLVISFVLGMTTQLSGEWFVQRYPHPPVPVPLGGIDSRIAQVGLSTAFYFSKVIWPWAPSPMYYQWKVDPPSVIEFLPWPVLAGLLYVSWKKRQSWGRHILLGVGFFVLLLAPFLGGNEISYMMFTWAMDHFLYIPMIGLIGLTVAGMGDVYTRIPNDLRSWSAGLVGILLLLLAVESRSYATTYASQEALCRYAVQLNPEAKLAYNNLGRILCQKGQISEAIDQFHRALLVDPDYIDGHYYLGLALMQANRLPQALQQFEQTIRLNRADADAYDNKGAILVQLGRLPEAVENLHQAIQLDNDFAEAHNDLGNALVQEGQIQEAIGEYQKALKIQPNVALVHENLGFALVKIHRLLDATNQFEAALQIDPSDENARTALVQLEREPK